MENQKRSHRRSTLEALITCISCSTHFLKVRWEEPT